MLTKKHFEAIARALRDARPPFLPDEAPHTYKQWRHTVEMFADTCAASNPRFNRSRFLEACGVDAS